MTDLNSLMIFAKVVEAKGFSEAARRLKMPTSTVSRRVADLEEQLGVRLLERSTRSLRLTDVGSEVFEHAQHSSRQHCFEPPVERFRRIAAFCATKYLRLVARAAGRRISGVLPEGPGAGLHHRPDC